MTAALRYAEDSHNIEYHKQARRFIFLVVDDAWQRDLQTRAVKA